MTTTIVCTVAICVTIIGCALILDDLMATRITGVIRHTSGCTNAIIHALNVTNSTLEELGKRSAGPPSE